jgi:hypothetical protein
MIPTNRSLAEQCGRRERRLFVSLFEAHTDITRGDSRYAALRPEDVQLAAPTPDRGEPLHENLAAPTAAIPLIRALGEHGCSVVWLYDYWNYAEIEKRIASCGAFLAFADAYYFSSTGKMIELAYATGQVASGLHEVIPPRRVYIYPVDLAHQKYRHLERPGRWIVLPSEPIAALHAITDTDDWPSPTMPTRTLTGSV